MIWDKLAFFYDLFENVYNGKVNRQLVRRIGTYVKNTDRVLECACGTGMLSVPLAENCGKLLATDYSVGMLKRAKKKMKHYSNVQFSKVSIMELPYKDNSFDVVVAANVIHLLDDPAQSLEELIRVCKPGGKVVIPTYVNAQKKEAGVMAGLLGKLGIDFKRQYDYESYKRFFSELGYKNIKYTLIEGRMPSAVALIVKRRG